MFEVNGKRWRDSQKTESKTPPPFRNVAAETSERCSPYPPVAATALLDRKPVDVVTPPWETGEAVSNATEDAAVPDDPAAAADYIAGVTQELAEPDGRPYRPNGYEPGVLESWWKKGVPGSGARRMIGLFAEKRRPILEAHARFFQQASVGTTPNTPRKRAVEKLQCERRERPRAATETAPPMPRPSGETGPAGASKPFGRTTATGIWLAATDPGRYGADAG